MSTDTLRISGYILIGLLAYAPGLAGEPGLPPCPTGLIEGPDPIGRNCEPKEKDKLGSSATYNRPEMGQDPSTGSPFMAWEEGEDGLRDIAFKMWTDGDWSSTEFLATSPADERDPRAFAAEDGTILITWWAEGRDPGVYYARREPLAGDWSPGVRVTADGRRPSIAVVSGRVLIVFERLRPTGRVDLVAIQGERDGRWTEQIVRAGAGVGSLANRVHHERGRTWVEWKISAGALAWSERVAGRWSQAQVLAVENRSWKAEQSARERVRETVLAH